MDWKEIILPLLLAAIAASPGIISLWKGRSKEKAEAANVITDAAKDLVTEYRAKMDELEAAYRIKVEEIEASCRKKIEEVELAYRAKVESIEDTVRKQSQTISRQERKIANQQIEIDRLKAEQNDFLRGVTDLCSQIRALGHEPVWEPKK